jgi:hypothetical protein
VTKEKEIERRNAKRLAARIAWLNLEHHDSNVLVVAASKNSTIVERKR